MLINYTKIFISSSTNTRISIFVIARNNLIHPHHHYIRILHRKNILCRYIDLFYYVSKFFQRIGIENNSFRLDHLSYPNWNRNADGTAIEYF